MRAALMLAAALAAAGCPGSLTDPSRFREGAECPDVPAEIFATKCAAGPCHAAYTPAAGLDLITPGVAERLVGEPAAGEECAGMGTLAVPDDPEASLLYLKLTGTPPCGAAMPLLAEPLSDKELSCVRDWIAAQGAPDPGDAGLDADPIDAAGADHDAAP